jgi:hypothetical protein
VLVAMPNHEIVTAEMDNCCLEIEFFKTGCKITLF